MARRKLGAFYTKYDIWLSPTTSLVAEPWGNYHLSRKLSHRHLVDDDDVVGQWVPGVVAKTCARSWDRPEEPVDCRGRVYDTYGPWGRPDMAMWIFTKALFAGEPLPLYNRGEMRRDFTYIDDIVRGVVACLDGPPADDGSAKAGGSTAPHALYNIGNHRSEDLMRVVELLEQATGKKALLDPQPMQPGDVKETFADISAIERDHGFQPATTIDEGVPRFVDWYREYHKV